MGILDKMKEFIAKKEEQSLHNQITAQEENTFVEIEYDPEYEEDHEKRKMYLEISYSNGFPFLDLFVCDEENEDFIINSFISLAENKQENMLYLPITFLNHMRELASQNYTLIEKKEFTSAREYARYKNWKRTRIRKEQQSLNHLETFKIDVGVEKPQARSSLKMDNNKLPRCPACGSQMEIKKAKRGANPGAEFWGCIRFPDCKGTRDISNNKQLSGKRMNKQ